MSEYGRAHRKVRDALKREQRELPYLKSIEYELVSSYNWRIDLLLSKGYEPFGHQFTDRGLVVVFWKRPVAATEGVEA